MKSTNQNFKELRKQLGYSLRYVSIHSKVAKSTIHRLEHDKEVGYHKLERLKAFYDAELEKKVKQ